MVLLVELCYDAIFLFDEYDCTLQHNHVWFKQKELYFNSRQQALYAY